MELTFEKVGNQYVAEFQATNDFNLHIEREEIGVLEVHQRGSEEGKYDFAWSTGVNGRKVVDYDFGALVYPKWIKVVSSSEVSKAFVTCPDGEVNQIMPSKYEFVDLGLPSGTKWATTNVGATKPEEFGLYFAWGETEGYEGIADDKKFEWNYYKLCGGSDKTLTKYNSDSSRGVVDNLSSLEQVDDAAYQSDNTCRMPTENEIQELIDNTISVWETLNGVNGRRFTSNTNGNSIFIPAAGNYYGDSVYNVGSIGILWSSSLYESNSKYANVHARYLEFSSSSVGMSNDERCIGFTIRPVQNK